MKILQDLWDSQLEEALSFPRLGATLVEKQLKRKGIVLTDEQLADLEAKLSGPDGDAITLSIDDDQVPTAYLKPEDIQEVLRIDLSDSEQDIRELHDEFAKGLSEVFPELVTDLGDLVLQQLKEDALPMMQEIKKDRTLFESRLAEKWHKPMELLELFLAIALEAGDDFNHEFRPQAAEQDDFVFEVLTRLHARGCQIVSEILALLKSGHADGAHARWRSLHEVAVVGMFIAASGNQTAESYLLHDAVESYKAARLYQECYERLGYEPLPDREVTEIEVTYQALVNRFGDAYKNTYGWAAAAIGKRNPTFRDIEAEVKLDHLRPFYKLASHNVHANPKGTFFKLGLYPEGQEILLAGPSDMGMADPGQGAALSLAQITVALLGLDMNLDRLVICHVLVALSDEIAQSFVSVQNLIEEIATHSSSEGEGGHSFSLFCSLTGAQKSP